MSIVVIDSKLTSGLVNGEYIINIFIRMISYGSTNFFILSEGEYNFRIKIQLIKQWVMIGINIENIEMKQLL